MPDSGLVNGAPDEVAAPLALVVRTHDRPGVLHALTSVILEHEANITYVDIAERHERGSTVYFELEGVSEGSAGGVIRGLQSLGIVKEVERAPSFQKVYGKRIIGAPLWAGTWPGRCTRSGRKASSSSP